MSTYWYYECLDHTPPLVAADEFTQHTHDEHYERGVALIGQRPVGEDDRNYWNLPLDAPDSVRSDVYFSNNARSFLREHPTCNLGVLNEYGEHVMPPRPELPREYPDNKGLTL